MVENSGMNQEGRNPNRREDLRFVTLRAERGHNQVDLEIPADRPIGEWLSELIKVIHWPPMEADRSLNYRLRTTSGRILSDGDTLIEAGIKDFDVLWISLIEPEPELDHVDVSHSAEHVQELEPASENGSGLPESDQHDGYVSITEPSLVSTSGHVFALGTPPISIGRKSNKHHPDIDLTELDEECASSRRHAMILRVKDRWLLLTKETTNGTFVNGVRLSLEDMHTLSDGDVIQFGMDGVELVFCNGTAES
jgi:hypothetical protein